MCNPNSFRALASILLVGLVGKAVQLSVRMNNHPDPIDWWHRPHLRPYCRLRLPPHLLLLRLPIRHLDPGKTVEGKTKKKVSRMRALSCGLRKAPTAKARRIHTRVNIKQSNNGLH